MPPSHATRRDFLTLTAAALASNLLRAQTPSLAHINVAELERTRVLAEATTALTTPIAPVAGVLPPEGKPNQFSSEIEPDIRTAGATKNPKLFRSQARRLRDFSATTACLSAAYLFT